MGKAVEVLEAAAGSVAVSGRQTKKRSHFTKSNSRRTSWAKDGKGGGGRHYKEVANKVYVGNLASHVGEEDLIDFFEAGGIPAESILKFVLKKGFAFVEFANQACADMALDNCNGKPLMNTFVRVEPAVPTEMPTKMRKLVQLMFNNCSMSMGREDIRALILESKVNPVSIEVVPSMIPGSQTYIVRVATMKQASQIMTAWNTTVVQGQRITIQILEESFTDGAAGDVVNQSFHHSHAHHHQQQQQQHQYLPKNAVYPDSAFHHDHHHRGNNFIHPDFADFGAGAAGMGSEQDIELPLRILIPNDFVGAIIGRGGSTIRAISKGTGARVDIYRTTTRGCDIPEKPISILGSASKCAAACQKILEIMSQESTHINRRNSGGSFGNNDHDSNNSKDAAAAAPANTSGGSGGIMTARGDILKMFIPSTAVGRVIGKSGSVIKDIMSDTETRIHITPRPDYLELYFFSEAIQNNKLVIIQGTIEGIMKAEAIISGKIREAYMDGKVKDRDLDFGDIYGYSQQGGGGMPQSQYGYTQYEVVGGGGGYGGGGQQRSQQQTQNGGTGASAASAATSYPMPSQSRSGFPLNLSSNDGLSLSRPETTYMYVPDDSVGALIGRGGSSIREIIHSSGASIKVLEGAIMLNGGAFRRVVIHGGVDSLFLAEYLIYRRVIDERFSQQPIEDPQLTIEMTVPSDIVGRLIGRGGSNVREIQRQNFCRIKFLTEPELSIPPPGEGETYVRITGTAHGFLNAQKRIRTLLVRAMNKAFSTSDTENGGGSGQGSSSNHNKSQYPEEEEEEEEEELIPSSTTNTDNGHHDDHQDATDSSNTEDQDSKETSTSENSNEAAAVMASAAVA